jgi:hypothetical protein
MPWFKVDDTLHSHPKARRAGLPAIGMWALAGSYSAAYATEGFVSEPWVASFTRGRRLATELVVAGLWVPAEKDGENGWAFHDWLKFQPSKAEIDADRAMASERQRRWRQKHRDAVSGKFTTRNGVTDDVTNDAVTP